MATVILPLLPALWALQVNASVHNLQCVRDRLTAIREHSNERRAASPAMLALAEELTWRHAMSEFTEDLKRERRWCDDVDLVAMEHESAPGSPPASSANLGARLDVIVGAALHRSRAAARVAQWVWGAGALAGMLSGLALWLSLRREWSAVSSLTPQAISAMTSPSAGPKPPASAALAPQTPPPTAGATTLGPADVTPVFRPMVSADPMRATVQADGSWIALSGRILVIEDNPINQRVTQRQLLELGLSVEIVDTAEDGLQRLQQSRFDVVLMDLQLPGMDGLTATRQWRAAEQREGRHRLPIIAITANATGSDRRACYDAGMDGYQAKPARLADLHRLLSRWVGPDKSIDAAASAVQPPEAFANPSLPDAARSSQSWSQPWSQSWSRSQSLPPSPSPSTSAAGNSIMGPQHALDTAVTLELTDPQLWVTLRRETATTDPRMLEELIADLRQQAEVTLSDLQEAFDAREHERLRGGAHRLKGSAGMLGLPRLAACAKAVEFAAKAQDDGVAGRALRLMRVVYADTLADPQVLALV